MCEQMLILVTFLAFPILALAQDQYLMTVAGYDGSQADQNLPPWDNQVNLLSLDPNVRVPDCLQGLNDFRYLEGACMAVLLEDQPHVCAGWDAYSGYNDKCYRYDPVVDSWTESGTLTVQRKEYAGCAFSYAHGMVIAGGFGIDNAPPTYLDTVEYTMHGNVFGKLADLPIRLQSDCFVAVWGGDLFIAGGTTYDTAGSSYVVSKKSFLYADYYNMWIELDDMITPRERMMCAIVVTGDGNQQEVIAAGGANELGDTSDVVEIYSVSSGNWRHANSLPSPIMEATAVPFQDSFLIVGGVVSGGSLSDLIYRYDVGTDSWELADARLPAAASGVAATMVNSYIFPPCAIE